MTGEVRERFLRAIAERVAPERVVQVDLFPALRHGGGALESAVAVVTAKPPDPETTEPGGDAGGAAADAAGEARVRFVVYRAQYVLTRKGPDRGKWEVHVTEEADAPTDAVDAVVRGVHERAGGDDEPERLDGDAFRGAVADDSWTAAR